MSPMVTAVLIALLGLTYGLPTDPIIKLDPDLRYGLMAGPDGKVHQVDLWLTVEGLQDVARFIPEQQNVFHLFTRENPTVSQPIIYQNNALLGFTNFNAQRRTALIIHGWLDSANSNLAAVLVPAYLETADMNVIVVDWNAGAGTINYAAAVANTVTSGVMVGNFINWLCSATGTTPGSFHVVGHSLGGHQSGIVGRNVNGNVAYITALDPAFPGWITHDHKFREDDGAYTEVIHTNSGLLGYIATLGHVDFYPNGGVNMPGCDSQGCDHDRCYYYLGESFRTGGFTGRRCASYTTAMTNNCILPGNLNMGGLLPKTGSSGVYRLETNAAPPFSRG